MQGCLELWRPKGKRSVSALNTAFQSPLSRVGLLTFAKKFVDVLCDFVEKRFDGKNLWSTSATLTG